MAHSTPMDLDMPQDVFLKNNSGPTIAEHALKCTKLFRNHIATPNIVPDPTVIDDQLARFTLWASNMDVFGPPNISLDYRLRYSPNIVDILHQLLDVIYNSLIELKPIIESPPTPSRKKRRKSISDQVHVVESDDNANDTNSDKDQAEKNISLLTYTINGTVTRLFRLSNAIRKSAKASRAQKLKDYQVDKDTQSAIDELRLYTDCYIRFRFPNAPESLRYALIEANVLRLRRLSYQRLHRRRIALSVPHLQSGQIKLPLSKIPETPRVVNFTPDVTPNIEDSNEEPGQQDYLPAPLTNATTAHQTEIGALYAKSTTEISQAKSMLVNNELSFPPIPQQNECPYCGVVIEFVGPNKYNIWRTHVIRDLEPFICLSTACTVSCQQGHDPLTFETSKAWTSHMQNSHGLTWECRAPSHIPMVFRDEMQFQKHCYDEHGVPETHVRTLSEAARRPFQDKIHECPFGDDFVPSEEVESYGLFSSEDLHSHVTTHMKELALLALQKLPTDGATEASDISSNILIRDDGGARFRRSMCSIMDDDELNFSDTAGDDQADDPKEKIISSIKRLNLEGIRQPPDHGATFRLEILPEAEKWDVSMVDKQEVERLIREALEVGRDVAISIESLASHPFQEQLVATLTFSKIPDKMVQLGATSQDFSDKKYLEDKSLYVSLYLDTHFHGFTPLHSDNSENSEKCLDIIALSGLNGHAFESFKHKGGRYMWLRDDLPMSMPNCRVFIYGNNTQLQESRSFHSLEDIGMDFKNALKHLVKANEKRGHLKPLVLLGHSLGGLVIKEALCKLFEARTTDDEIVLKSLRSIMFFGTPNQGIDTKLLIPMVKGQANESFPQSLGRDSPGLRHQAQRWSRVIDVHHNPFVAQDLEIISYYETHPSPTAIHYGGKWTMSGQPVQLVDRSSATHGRSWEIEERYIQPIDRSHSELVKFHGRTDPTYVSHVLPRLQGFLDNLDQDSVDLQYTKELCLLFEAMCAKSEPPASVKQLCESPDIEQSMAWFIESQEYQAWKKSSSAKLCLQEASGDGKTVVMSYILRSLRQLSLQTDKLDVASIFCSNEDSEAGIVASLVTQLLKKNKDRAEVVQTDFSVTKLKQCGNPWELTPILWKLLVASVKATTQLETVFLVDGVDALHADVRSSFLKNFHMLEEQVALAPMRVLISSKFDEDTKRALAHYSSIDREKERRECLKTLAFQEWNARESRVEDKNEGGAWLSSHPGYQDWKSTSTPSVLWLEGKPGSGKSTVTKFIVHNLEGEEHDLVYDQRRISHNSVQQDKQTWTFNNPENKRTIVARFYYSFRGGSTEMSHELMLRSIVYQIWKQNNRLFPLLRGRYRELKKNMGDVREQKALWSYDDLKQALNSLHKIDFDLKVVIVVDGMDESDNDRRSDVLQFLPSLAFKKSSCIVKLLFTSRPENDINFRLGNACSHHIKLQQVNQVDVELVVDSWIGKMESDYNCGKDTFLFIKDHIMNRSSGVFLWVTLVLRDMEQCIRNGGYNKVDLDNRVAAFPKELGGKDGFYRAIIDTLIKNCKEDREEQEERGRRILAWITFLKRPPSVTELQEVLATPPISKRVDFSGYDLAYHRPLDLDQGILSTCGGLVEVLDSGPNQVVQLIHQTAREFLLDKNQVAKPYHLDEVQGDTEIAITCCRYIRLLFMAPVPQMEYDASFSRAEKLIGYLSGHMLLSYALTNFTMHLDHLKRNDKEKEIRLEFESFLNDLSRRRNSYACLLLCQWIETLNWTKELRVDVNKTSARSCFRAMISCAANSNELEIAKLLLALRVDILHVEAQEGSVTSARILIDAGANIHAIDASGQTPLHLAVKNGRHGIVEILTRNGANVMAKDASGQKPLDLAVENGNKEIAKMLIRNGADVMAEDASGRKPLHLAVENGRNGIAKMLIRNGADVMAKDSSGRVPLDLAVENKNEEIIEMLMRNGPDDMAKGARKRTRLTLKLMLKGLYK